MTNPTSHLTGQVTHPGPSISLCAQSLHWIKACFCVPFAKIKTFCTNVWVLLYKNFSSYGTSSSCCLRKYINILFFLYKYLQYSSTPFNNILLYIVLPHPLPRAPSPLPSRTSCIYTFTAEAGNRAGGLPLMRSLCRGTAVAGRDGESSSAPCMGKAGSFRSSPLQTGTGCGE